MLPAIGLVTVKLPKVPTEVKDEESTFEAKVAPVKVVASATAVMVILPVPSNGTPLMFLAVANAVAVLAFPVKAPVNPVEVTEVNPVMVAGKLNTGVAPPVDAI